MELVLLIDQIQPHHAVSERSGKESGGSADSLQWLFAKTTAVGWHQAASYSNVEAKSIGRAGMDSVRSRLADASLVSKDLNF